MKARRAHEGEVELFLMWSDELFNQLASLMAERRPALLLNLDNGLSYRADHAEWGVDEDGHYIQLPVTDLVSENVRRRDLGYDLECARIEDVVRVTDARTGEVIYLRCGSRRVT